MVRGVLRLYAYVVVCFGVCLFVVCLFSVFACSFCFVLLVVCGCAFVCLFICFSVNFDKIVPECMPKLSKNLPTIDQNPWKNCKSL